MAAGGGNFPGDRCYAIRASWKRIRKLLLAGNTIGADLVLFPEMYSIGYWFPKNENEISIWKEQAITLDSDFINEYKQLAKDLEISIAITFLRKNRGKYFNSLALIDPKGNIVLDYDKLHTCVFGDETYCDSGNKFKVCELETKKGVIKIGAMICLIENFQKVLGY
jgi:predicted amidohydrolase